MPDWIILEGTFWWNNLNLKLKRFGGKYSCSLHAMHYEYCLTYMYM